MSATKEHYHDQIEAGQRSSSSLKKEVADAGSRRIEETEATNPPLIPPFPKGDERKEHPILFSTPMVRAILEGRKSQTRRTTGFKEINDKPNTNDYIGTTISVPFSHEFSRISVGGKRLIFHEICPYGEPSDLLWVRESFSPNYFDNLKHGYKADWNSTAAEYVSKPKWKPGIHMPKAAARIWLEVEEISVERLQDISEEDAIAEGAQKAISWMNTNQIEYVDKAHVFYSTGSYRLGFQKLWISINGIESWHENPWVWVIKFRTLSTTGKTSIDSAQDDKTLITNN